MKEQVDGYLHLDLQPSRETDIPTSVLEKRLATTMTAKKHFVQARDAILKHPEAFAGMMNLQYSEQNELRRLAIAQCRAGFAAGAYQTIEAIDESELQEYAWVTVAGIRAEQGHGADALLLLDRVEDSNTKIKGIAGVIGAQVKRDEPIDAPWNMAISIIPTLTDYRQQSYAYIDIAEAIAENNGDYQPVIDHAILAADTSEGVAKTYLYHQIGNFQKSLDLDPDTMWQKALDATNEVTDEDNAYDQNRLLLEISLEYAAEGNSTQAKQIVQKIGATQHAVRALAGIRETQEARKEDPTETISELSRLITHALSSRKESGYYGFNEDLLQTFDLLLQNNLLDAAIAMVHASPDNAFKANAYLTIAKKQIIAGDDSADVLSEVKAAIDAIPPYREGSRSSELQRAWYKIYRQEMPNVLANQREFTGLENYIAVRNGGLNAVLTDITISKDPEERKRILLASASTITELGDIDTAKAFLDANGGVDYNVRSVAYPLAKLMVKSGRADESLALVSAYGLSKDVILSAIASYSIVDGLTDPDAVIDSAIDVLEPIEDSFEKVRALIGLAHELLQKKYNPSAAYKKAIEAAIDGNPTRIFIDLGVIAKDQAKNGIYPEKVTDLFRQAISREEDFKEPDSLASIAGIQADFGKFDAFSALLRDFPDDYSQGLSWVVSDLEKKGQYPYALAVSKKYESPAKVHELTEEAIHLAHKKNDFEMLQQLELVMQTPLEQFILQCEQIAFKVRNGKAVVAERVHVLNLGKQLLETEKENFTFLKRLAILESYDQLSESESAALTQDKVEQLVRSSRNRLALEGVGYANILRTLPSDIPYESQVSILLGRADSQQDEESLREAQRIAREQQTAAVAKVFVEGIMYSQTYEEASGNLFQILNALTADEVDSANDRQVLQVLKGLIEIGNPRGLTLATRFAADRTLSPRYREYLTRKLMQEEYWDPKLGQYLTEKVSGLHDAEAKAESVAYTGSVLASLINEFGLTPDLPSYQALEAPGLAKADTLEERVIELKEKAAQFNGKTRDELLDMFAADESARQLYYIIKAGEFRYSVVNDYSVEKFKAVTDKVRELRVHEAALYDFQDLLMHNGMDEQQAKALVQRLKEGHPVTAGGDERVIRFSTNVEFGSNYESALARLQDVWKVELKSLLMNKALGQAPATMTDSIGVMDTQLDADDQQKLKSARKVVQRLQIDKDKISVDDIAAIVKDVRGSLIKRARDAGDRDKASQLKTASDVQVIKEYVETALPISAASDEWKNHLETTLQELAEAKQAKKAGRKVKSQDLELTFLDKNKDFMRALRFADAAQCCFNASNANFRNRTYEYVTRLNKDPLSFMMDLKEAGSDTILGFIFGRLGYNPQTGHPVVMLNGIYSQIKGTTLNDNILNIIEANMGEPLGADIVIASAYGGTINKPTGYEGKIAMPLVAMRAIEDRDGEPETDVYDDIGNVANGEFSFSGYVKQRTE